jgi:hypothetical protein
MPGAPAEGRVENPADRAADVRAAQALAKTIPMSVDNVPLEEALAHFSEVTGIDIVPDWKALQHVDVRPDSQVSLRLRQGAAAEQVLTWLLRSAGGDAAGFALEHGVIVIAPRERLDRMVVTRAYDLGNFASDGKALETLVRETVAPHSWREQGGAGAVRFFNKRLFVTATEPNHRQVERLLGLVEAQGGPGPGAMPEMPGGSGAADPGAQPGPSRRPLGLRQVR